MLTLDKINALATLQTSKEDACILLSCEMDEIDSFLENNGKTTYDRLLTDANIFFAKKAGFLPCTGRDRSLIALYYHNTKTSKVYQKATINAHAIQLLLESILDGLMYIRYFDRKRTFQCVDAEYSLTSDILTVDIKSIAINIQKPDF